MLTELTVENYAVVEQARIHFHEGLNLLTGETGSGKSIVIDSLGLLFGARASAEMVRTGQTKARVSGVFCLEHTPELFELLSEAGLDREDGEDLIVERELTAAGKSRAFVASRQVTTAFLRQLAPLLGDIHGQNEQQRLFESRVQRDTLDRFGRAAGLRDEVARTYAEWRVIGERLEELRRGEQEKLRLLDLWTFQKKEIETAAPHAGEDEKLEAERRILQNATRLEENAAAAFALLYDSPGSALSQVRQAQKRVNEVARIDLGQAETGDLLRQAAAAIDEAALELRDYLSGLEGDPERLEEVETRLATLDKLKRKYGGTLQEVQAFLTDVTQRIDEVEHAAQHEAALEAALQVAAERYEALAGQLSNLRQSAAARLSEQVETELKSLAMGGTSFQISVERGNWTAAGWDEVKFLVSPNRGEELKPMERIASGGELSRLALALKTAIGDADERGTLHTLVFDEVDAGVGGAAAAAVGRRLKALARRNQVICVTHLAQIAGFADHHYAVSKRERDGRVTTAVDELSRDERAREIGRMLSGDKITPEALRQAEQLMK
ncbi:MAG TPA: DNA repair protein RecN [Bryobacteraceae bacterium]|jgi:DNA repair protein RecN (Recombination protein N)|nr:DNA repair protein RecN [Bryobacteraceae bacterium]